MSWDGFGGGSAENVESQPERTKEAEVSPQEQVEEVPEAPPQVQVEEVPKTVSADPTGMS